MRLKWKRERYVQIEWCGSKSHGKTHPAIVIVGAAVNSFHVHLVFLVWWMQKVIVNKAVVEERLKHITMKTDVSRYIL